MAKEITFVPATRQQARARALIFGPSGSGKTYTGLLIATQLGERLAVIDTEHGSAAKYSDEFEFAHYLMEPPYHPQHYINAIKKAEDMGFDVLLIDSITHEWEGTGGVKEIVDAAKGKFGNNQWSAWSVGTPLHNQFLETLQSSSVHIVCTARAKTEWSIQEDDRGKRQPVKIGLGPQQRDNIEYEFDVALLLDMSNDGTVVKSRVRSLPPGSAIEKPGEEFGQAYLEWLEQGVKLEKVEKKVKKEEAKGDEAPTQETLDAIADPTPTRPAKAPTKADKKADKPGQVPSIESREQVVMLLDKLQAEFGDHPEGMPWAKRMEDKSIEWFGKSADKLDQDDVNRLLVRLENSYETMAARTPAKA